MQRFQHMVSKFDLKTYNRKNAKLIDEQPPDTEFLKPKNFVLSLGAEYCSTNVLFPYDKCFIYYFY